MKKLVYLRGAATAELNGEIAAYLERYRDDDTLLTVISPAQGPRHLEYECYQALAAPELLRLIQKAERDGVDALVIGCFDDPALTAARELCRHMVVTGLGESAMLLAAQLGDRFSVLVGRDKWIPPMRDNALRYGCGDKLASFRSLGLGVREMQQDPERTAALMRREIRAALDQDKAEAIVLGCAMEFGFYEQLQQEFGVPVIDAMVAGFKQAEYLTGLRQRCGWSFSKAGLYAGPDPAELRNWGIEL